MAWPFHHAGTVLPDLLGPHANGLMLVELAADVTRDEVASKTSASIQ